MRASAWIGRMMVVSSLLCAFVALPACDSSSSDDEAESDDEDEEKKKKRRKKKRKKRKKKSDKPTPIEVKSIPDFVVPAGGKYFKKEKMEAYSYKPLSKYPLEELKANFKSHLKDKGWTVTGDVFYKVTKGDTKVDVAIIANKKADACVLNIMAPSTEAK